MPGLSHNVADCLRRVSESSWRLIKRGKYRSQHPEEPEDRKVFTVKRPNKPTKRKIFAKYYPLFIAVVVAIFFSNFFLPTDSLWFTIVFYLNGLILFTLIFYIPVAIYLSIREAENPDPPEVKNELRDKKINVGKRKRNRRTKDQNP